MTRNNFIFLMMIMATSLGQIISDLYLPSFPAIAEEMGTSLHAVQFSLSIYMFGFGISILVYGPVSDAVGRRVPLLVGLGLCLAGSIICFSAPSITILNIGRLIQGLGAGATLSVASPVLRDLFEREVLAKYASYSALIGVGFLTMAPLLGGYFQEYAGWRASFVFIAIYTLIVVIAIFLKVPETNKNKGMLNLTYAGIKKNLNTLVTSRIFIGYCACSFLAYGALLAWLTAGPVVLETIVGLSPVDFGKVYILTGVGFAFGAFLNAKWVERFGINKMLLLGIFCIFLAGIIMTGTGLMGYINSFVIVGAAVLLLFGASLVFPNTSAGVFQPFPHIAGITSALFYALRMLNGSLFSGLLAIVPDQTQVPMGLSFISCALLAWIIFYFALRTHEKI